MANLGNRLADVGACEAAEVNVVVEAGEVVPLNNEVDDNRADDDREDNGETRA